jgi:hypothetical protein
MLDPFSAGSIVLARRDKPPGTEKNNDPKYSHLADMGRSMLRPYAEMA